MLATELWLTVAVVGTVIDTLALAWLRTVTEMPLTAVTSPLTTLTVVSGSKMTSRGHRHLAIVAK
jgi:hypothetical protein